MTVVPNTSPLNYLAQLGEAEALATLCGEIHIPASVRAELDAVEAPPEVRRWIASPPPVAANSSRHCPTAADHS